MRIIGLLLALALAGCASYVWTKPEATQADRNVDDYACEVENRYLVPPPPPPVSTSPPVSFAGGFAAAQARNRKPTVEVDTAGYRGCMRARGWTREKEPSNFSLW